MDTKVKTMEMLTPEVPLSIPVFESSPLPELGVDADAS